MALPKGQLLSNWEERQLKKFMAKVNIYGFTIWQMLWSKEDIVRNLTVEPVIGSYIKEDITEIGTFKLKHKVQVNQMEKKGRGLEDFRVKL